MKNLLILTVVIATLSGCKKGENDPFLSFRGRDARIIGEWTITNYEYDEKGTNASGNTTVNVLYNGSTYTTTKSGAPAPPDLTKYTYTLSIEKGGKLTLTTVTQDATTSGTKVESGTWEWGQNNKNKSVVHLNVEGDLMGRNYFEGGSFNVDQLRNKEIILTQSEESSETTSGIAGINETLSISTTVTLTQ